MKKSRAGTIFFGFVFLLTAGFFCFGMRIAEAATDNFKIMREETFGFIKLNLPAAEVLKGMGEPEQKSETKIWGADGLEHQTWYYPAKGVVLGMVGSIEKQSVDRVSMKNPCELKTSRGIGMGSTAEEVRAAYGNEINSKESRQWSTQSNPKIVVGSIFGGIIFTMTEDKVSAIFLGAAAE